MNIFRIRNTNTAYVSMYDICYDIYVFKLYIDYMCVYMGGLDHETRMVEWDTRRH